MNVLDATDRKIVMLLQEDGTRPRAEIGRVVGLSEAAVRRRVDSLLRSEVIQIVAIADPAKVGLDTMAIVGIRVVPGQSKAVVAKLVKNRKIRWVGYTTGQYDVIVELMLPTMEHLLMFVSEDIGAIKGISATETSVVMRIAKRTYATIQDDATTALPRVVA